MAQGYRLYLYKAEAILIVLFRLLKREGLMIVMTGDAFWLQLPTTNFS